MSAETTTALSVLLESSSLAVDKDSDVDYPAFIRWETAVLDAWEHDRFYCNEVAFTCRQIKQLLRFIYKTIHLNFVTAYELPLFGHFSNSVTINCKMPYTCTKRSFPLFGYEQELRQTILPTFKEAVKQGWEKSRF